VPKSRIDSIVDEGRREQAAEGHSYRRIRAWNLEEKNFCTMIGVFWGKAGMAATVDDPPPPGYMLACNTYQAARWREAWVWRVALDAAAGIVGSRRKVTVAS